MERHEVAPGVRVRLMLSEPVQYEPRWITGTVEDTDAAGVTVRLDRAVRGAHNCAHTWYATADELRPARDTLNSSR